MQARSGFMQIGGVPAERSNKRRARAQARSEFMHIEGVPTERSNLHK